MKTRYRDRRRARQTKAKLRGQWPSAWITLPDTAEAIERGDKAAPRPEGGDQAGPPQAVGSSAGLPRDVSHREAAPAQLSPSVRG